MCVREPAVGAVVEVENVVVVAVGETVRETSHSVVIIAGVSSVDVMVTWVVLIVICGSVVVVRKGYSVVGKSSCFFVNLFNTYANTPRAKIVPTMRKKKRNLGRLFGFTLDTCPFFNSFMG